MSSSEVVWEILRSTELILKNTFPIESHITRQYHRLYNNLKNDYRYIRHTCGLNRGLRLVLFSAVEC